jgi:hypothetical protein
LIKKNEKNQESPMAIRTRPIGRRGLYSFVIIVLNVFMSAKAIQAYALFQIIFSLISEISTSKTLRHINL